MRIIITGSREWKDEMIVRRSLSRFIWQKPTIVMGDCRTGVDAMAMRWCIGAGLEPVIFGADWDKHGKAAGPMRDAAMVQSGADMCIGFVDLKASSRSKGTRGCLVLARAAGITTHAYVLGRGWLSEHEVDEVANASRKN